MRWADNGDSHALRLLQSIVQGLCGIERDQLKGTTYKNGGGMVLEAYLMGGQGFVVGRLESLIHNQGQETRRRSESN